MREIKFRLIKNNKIVGYERFVDGEWTHAYTLDDDEIWSTMFYIKHDSKDQYTGLKDKNGTEIYEGDIVKTRNNVIWKIEYNLYKFVLTNSENYSINLGPYYKEIEVIGNIYENPELLDE